VGDLVERLRLPQPAVSKQLSVIRQVGIVSVTKQGQQRFYQLDAEQLKPVHDWVKAFERLWGNQLDRIKLRAEQKARQRAAATRIKPTEN
jgi:DNA-binding transcriptional ArsR family regulator